MSNTLVIKYNETKVQNPSTESGYPLNYHNNEDITLTITVKASSANTFQISALNGTVTLTASGGLYFTNSSYSTNAGTSKSIASGATETVYLSSAGTLSIAHAQYIRTFIVGDNMSTSEFDLSQLHNMTNLSQFSWTNNWGVSGYIGGLRDSSDLTSLNLESTSANGDTSTFKSLSGLTYLNISKSEIGGDIRHFANLTNLTTLILSSSGVHGSFYALRKLTNLTRCDIQSIPVYDTEYWNTTFNTTCTINGTGAVNSGGSGGDAFTFKSDDSQYDQYLYALTDSNGKVLAYYDNSGDFHITGNIYAANL